MRGVMSTPFGCHDIQGRIASSQQAVNLVIKVDDATSNGTGVLVVGEPHSGAYVPLVVALRLRITQIVHHSGEDPTQVFVGNVLGTNADEMYCRVPQALLHAASPGGERVHRVGQLLKGVEAVRHRI